MRRCCGDQTLADDLAQQVFLQAWRDIAKLRNPHKFAAWLKRLAINTWRQHLRKHDPLRNADAAEQAAVGVADTTAVAVDLDRALGMLAPEVRLCVVLSYHEGMSHAEIVRATDLPLGTVKSHVRRGTSRLREALTAYLETAPGDVT